MTIGIATATAAAAFPPATHSDLLRRPHSTSRYPKKGKGEPSVAHKILQRLVAGTAAGIVSSLFSHPFDTIKSRMQQGLSPSIGSCVKDMHSVEGLRGFYRGVTPPLVVNGSYNAVLFSVNQLMTWVVMPKDHPKGEPLSYWRVALAAQLTAPFTALVVTPAEVIKVRLQVQPKGRDRLYSGPIDCAKRLIHEQGPKALLRGYLPTLGTRIVGLPFYFLAYEGAKSYLHPRKPTVPTAVTGGSQQSVSELAGTQKLPSRGVVLTCGAAAGVAFWTACYPIDFVKTSVQANSLQSPAEVVRTTYHRGGFAGFYRGYPASIIRAVPANASVFLVVEETLKWMDRRGF